jgi:hypothetical protein
VEGEDNARLGSPLNSALIHRKATDPPECGTQDVIVAGRGVRLLTLSLLPICSPPLKSPMIVSLPC